jgi:hypothetical protein
MIAAGARRASVPESSAAVVRDEDCFAEQMVLDYRRHHRAAGFSANRQFGDIHRVDREHIAMRRIPLGRAGPMVRVGAQIRASLLGLRRQHLTVLDS